MAAELSFSDEYHGRFRLYGPPLPLPGKCAVCGNAREQVVDFGATIDGWGALLFCWRCVIEATGQLVRAGLVKVPQPVPPSEYERVFNSQMEEFDARMGNLITLLNVSRDSIATIASESAQRNAEVADSASGEREPDEAGIDQSASDNVGDERPSSLPSSRSDKTLNL